MAFVINRTVPREAFHYRESLFFLRNRSRRACGLGLVCLILVFSGAWMRNRNHCITLCSLLLSRLCLMLDVGVGGYDIGTSTYQRDREHGRCESYVRTLFLLFVLGESPLI
ncbi:hypothetical protein CONLIGDRAFT_117821 [Coniochaeta ligniaria NRRL 30616]|uniref:Uncharacterized protein n=1 Tax=Coniochaeta ligniaria NRRL 30616 TaxID=1408157 RepID=A0A1J7J448_9PEZI|nr:hypothetical protein CONLIGDRAFT_117821 [Coniochaeta ligniaria NRRL 30616]